MERANSPAPRRPLSPAESSRLSTASPQPGPTRPAPPPNLPLAKRRLKSTMRRSSLEPVIEGETKILRDARQAQPADGARLARPQSTLDPAEQRHTRFEDGVRAAYTPTWSPKDLVRGESVVLAEVKTNVMVTNEYTFITGLSTHLSVRYSRPVSSIVVTLQHGVCMLLGGSFEPAYTIAISALPCQVQMTTNKRNVALLQAHLLQALRVPPTRGFVRFVPVPEECSSRGGKTVAGEIAALVASGSEQGHRMPRRGSIKSGYTDNDKSLALRRPASPSAMDASTLSSRSSRREHPPGRAPSVTPAQGNGGFDKSSEPRSVKMTKRKSFIYGLLRRSPKSEKSASSRTSL
ncbi:hypothetical protein TPAR_02668 [Tolypocladium paradoxum]|uniref:L-dopachrome isomerase n=1 Tax=Tolypocladium paradoxum TaxID=94208 RepID=A0A2S4L458_9HYPO|nr:hypothetical protein TPAR_02668 [Tolypocladium paradoxum]